MALHIQKIAFSNLTISIVYASHRGRICRRSARQEPPVSRSFLQSLLRYARVGSIGYDASAPPRKRHGFTKKRIEFPVVGAGISVLLVAMSRPMTTTSTWITPFLCSAPGKPMLASDRFRFRPIIMTTPSRRLVLKLTRTPTFAMI